MKFTALLQETVTRNLRVIVNADSKGQAKRLLTNMAATDQHYKESIVVARVVSVTPLLETIEPLTPESFK